MDTMEIFASQHCPQCPGGGYDLLEGARRQELLRELSAACVRFADSGEISALLDDLEMLAGDGLAPGDLEGLSIKTDFGDFDLLCREVRGGLIHIEIVSEGQSVCAQLPLHQVKPRAIKTIPICPLLSPEDKAGCNSDTCEILVKARRLLREQPAGE